MINRFNRRAQIYSAQEMLYDIAKYNPDVPTVFPDGIFGVETKNALLEFQRLYGLDITGAIDNQTLDALRRESQIARNSFDSPNRIAPFARVLEGGKVSAGDEFDLVFIIQIMLETLGITSEAFEGVVIDGVYGKNTQDAVRSFQKMHSIEETGDVDRETWDLLANMYNSHVGKNQ